MDRANSFGANGLFGNRMTGIMEIIDYLTVPFLFFVVGPAMIIAGGLVFSLIAKLIAGEDKKERDD